MEVRFLRKHKNLWFLNSVGLECYPYKVEVVGSSPTGTTIFNYKIYG